VVYVPSALVLTAAPVFAPFFLSWMAAPSRPAPSMV
jgi:hypothetical protein